MIEKILFNFYLNAYCIVGIYENSAYHASSKDCMTLNNIQASNSVASWS